MDALTMERAAFVAFPRPSTARMEPRVPPRRKAAPREPVRKRNFDWVEVDRSWDAWVEGRKPRGRDATRFGDPHQPTSLYLHPKQVSRSLRSQIPLPRQPRRFDSSSRQHGRNTSLLSDFLLHPTFLPANLSIPSIYQQPNQPSHQSYASFSSIFHHQPSVLFPSSSPASLQPTPSSPLSSNAVKLPLRLPTLSYHLLGIPSRRVHLHPPCENPRRFSRSLEHERVDSRRVHPPRRFHLPRTTLPFLAPQPRSSHLQLQLGSRTRTRRGRNLVGIIPPSNPSSHSQVAEEHAAIRGAQAWRKRSRRDDVG